MGKPCACVLVLLLVLGLAGPCAAANATDPEPAVAGPAVSRIEVVAHGLFEDLPRAAVDARPRGRAFCPPLGVRPLRSTRHVPDSLFTRFGILFVARGPDAANATLPAEACNASFSVDACNASFSEGAGNASFSEGAGNATLPADIGNATLSGEASNASPPISIPPREQWPDKVRLELRILHPLIEDPIGGRASTAEVWPLEACLDQPAYAGWMFTSDWERVRGDWTLELYHNGTRLASEVFQVVEPALVGRIPLRVSLRGLGGAPEGNGTYCLSAGSFLDSLPRADVLARRLRGKGYPAAVDAPQRDGSGTWYTVVLGGYAGPVEAARAAERLRSHEGVETRMLPACPAGAPRPAPVASSAPAQVPVRPEASPGDAASRIDTAATKVALPATYDNTTIKAESVQDAAGREAALSGASAPGAEEASRARNATGGARRTREIVATDQGYWVVVGMHAGAMAAAGQAVRLRDRGVAAKVFSLLEGGTLRYEVRMGPFAEARGARAAAEALAAGTDGTDGAAVHETQRGGGG